MTVDVASPTAWSVPAAGLTRHGTTVVLRTLRALLRAETKEDVVKTLGASVRELGVSLAPPAEGHAAQVPIDVTFGVGDPLVPTGDPAVLEALRDVLSSLVEDARQAFLRVQREEYLATNATTDALTGLPNRRMAMRALARVAAGDVVAILDLDHFKQVNDTLGHDEGDVVLRRFGDALRAELRAADIAGRLGGEEFIAILPRTDVEGACRLLERLRQRWRVMRPHPTTFSAGVAAAVEPGGRAALTRADVALYAAKSNGRNRTEVSRG